MTGLPTGTGDGFRKASVDTDIEPYGDESPGPRRKNAHDKTGGNEGNLRRSNAGPRPMGGLGADPEDDDTVANNALRTNIEGYGFEARTMPDLDGRTTPGYKSGPTV